MTVSTDGQICYGIHLGEDVELPWDDGEHDGDIADWWRDLNGFKHSFEIYDARGEYIGGTRPSESTFSAYFGEQDEFDKAHPMPPITMVNCCSGDYPDWIIALEDTALSASRGFPETFNPADLTVTDEQRNMLIEFCKTHNIETNDEKPKWWLSSYWG